MTEQMKRPSDRLWKYDSVLVIQLKIGYVPVYKFIEKFLFVENEDGIKVPFILRDEQVDFYIEICEQKLSGKPIRADVLKARQLGFSTLIAGIIFSQVLFKPGMKAAIIADIAEHATNLFNKYIFFYESLPDDIKQRLPKEKSNAKELVIKQPNGQFSSIRIMVQGDSAGRSGTYQYLHLSECAFWDNLKETLTSLLQTVSNTNLNSMVFLETTANGVNDYKLRWDEDYAGNTSYLALFFGWKRKYRVKERDLRDYFKPDWLVDLIERENLDECQAQWYYDKWLEFSKDLDLLRQEFPSNPVEAFITSGNQVFNAELLRKRKEEIIKMPNKGVIKQGFFTFTKKHSLDGGRIEISNITWVDSKTGSIKIYKEVEERHPYVVCNDNANGGEDYFATQVFDNYTGKQVAVYHKNKCDADDAAYQMYCLGKYYNEAMLTGETNITAYLLQLCQKCGYKFIYQDQDIEELGTRYFNKLGYKTKQNNRQQMIDMFKIAFREDPTIVNDYDTICEMESFQVVRHKNGTEKVEASGGAHDDLVMSACGFYLCRGQQISVPFKNDNQSKIKFSNPDDLMEYLSQKRKNSMQKRSVYQIWD